MPSSRETLDRWAARLHDAGTVSSRKMMGEYIIYVDGKIIGGIYDDRFLLKITKASATAFRDAPSVMPYEGGSEMILVGESADPDVLKNAITGMLAEFPEPKKRK